MDEAEREQIEIMIRERVLAMLGAMQDAANWYTSGYDDPTESAARVVSDVVDRTARELTPAAPEPVNPFAPVSPAKDWAEGIAALIRQAENDGHGVWIENTCCGCSRVIVGVGSETDHTHRYEYGEDK